MVYSKITQLKWILPTALALLSASCIQDEALNTECDIVSIELPTELLLRSPQIENDSIKIIVNDYVDVSALSPKFTLTVGASIEPASGTTRDFSTPQTYVTTSQDGGWHKNYVIYVEKECPVNLKYSFENVYTETQFNATYDVFYEVNPDNPEEKTMTWASGNQGYAWTFEGSTPNTFPTFQQEDGYEGKCVELVTRSTGNLGANVKKPIAAGNLFIGRFDLSNAIARPLEATQFGTPFRYNPIYLTGYYKYTPGATYTRMLEDGSLQEVPDKQDECNIYASFFEVTDDVQNLNGSNVLSSDNIIASAELDATARKGTADWTYFRIPFELREGKSIDPDKLAAGAYSLTIVFASSIDGDYFSGAIGSRLLVDEVELFCGD